MENRRLRWLKKELGKTRSSSLLRATDLLKDIEVTATRGLEEADDCVFFLFFIGNRYRAGGGCVGLAGALWLGTGENL
tara:strand:+ start:697 stop:930 length:234 start_codon:yes stop_codon:yes gene_type:complete